MFQIGQRVRISQEAFRGSNDPESISLRGQIGVLAGLLEEDEEYFVRIWLWRSDGGQEAALFDSELEQIIAEN